mgnify:CR=1 FL=1
MIDGKRTVLAFRGAQTSGRRPSHEAPRMNPIRLAAPPILLFILLSVGCSAPVHRGEPTGERRVQYVCGNGEEIEMRFFPLQGVGVLVRHRKPMELQQQPVVSGFLYSNGPNTVRGKDSELIIEVGRRVPTKRQARRDPARDDQGSPGSAERPL